MGRTGWLWLLLLLLVTLSAGCPMRGSDAGTDDAATGTDAGTDAAGTDAAGTDAGTDAGPTGVAAQLCGTLVPAVCATIFSCCDPAVQAMFGGTLAQCLTDSMIACTTDYAPLDTSAAMGRLVLDPAALAACALAFDALATSCDANLFATVMLQCFVAIDGQVPNGGSCTVPSSELEAAECADGWCSGTSCTPFPPEGGDCSLGVCDPALHRCVSSGPGMSTCETPLPDGGSCTSHFECASFYCGPGGICAPYAGQDVCLEIV